MALQIGFIDVQNGSVAMVYDDAQWIEDKLNILERPIVYQGTIIHKSRLTAMQEAEQWINQNDNRNRL